MEGVWSKVGAGKGRAGLEEELEPLGGRVVDMAESRCGLVATR